ncbi:SDR family NAD(P)-dependent oxidoreductase [Phenylobacterium montanum]|uniref:D-xylose 1-dehydrogenase n=1 Tax=Phenylobacterium montanum TaxID=2823693 RepID=A0A975IWT2_9CAUL|nr:glucose 1-dehydrogenase [Caulobacter sp. S6]QUD88696.1 glucose 1-dehydrogenase [Caulobacter sp. S6]
MSVQERFDLSGKTALVTGGSRGLGLQMVLAFAEAGADVVIASRKLEACEEAAAAVRALGRKALPVACHVGHWGDVERLVETAYAEMGRIDILVNNAGMSPLAPSSAETSEALFDKVLEVNFKGPFRLAALVGERMVQGGGGAIINISSSGAIRPQPRFLPYAGAKAALNVMTEGFAKEFGPSVRVNCIMAGPFLTDISKAWDEASRETAPNALGRPGRPEEIVTAALYLASPQSSFTTGSVIRVDGGMA